MIGLKAWDKSSFNLKVRHIVSLRFSYGMSFMYLRYGNLSLLDIPACRENMKDLSDSEADDLKDMAEEHERRKCLVPVSQTFPTLEAIAITHEFVITVQMSVTSRDDAENIGSKKYLPSKILAKRQWCHVFLTDADKVNTNEDDKHQHSNMFLNFTLAT
ncbi:hypothetical protein EDB86DRAFT_3086651 [Lactarius hatsudake]|nr:hypothetical protein EDB86DRAFT_3086651 [Lactarius hatsudake]